MNADQLYDALIVAGDDGAQLTLRPDSRQIARLGRWLKSVVDRRGALTISAASRVEEARADRLTVSGKALVHGVSANATAVFDLRKGEIDGFHIVFALEDGWQLSQNFPALSSYGNAATFLAGLRFKRAFLVVAANAGPITMAKTGLRGENFENGLNFYAGGLLSQLPVADMSYEMFGSTWPVTSETPNEIKGHLEVWRKGLSVSMQVWWPENPEINDKISGAQVVRPGWLLNAMGLGEGKPWVTASWMWELQAQADEDSFVMIAEPPATEGGSCVYSAIFSSAQFLQGGANALASFTEGSDPGDAMPFDMDSDDAPELSLAALSVSPGNFFSCELMVTDRDSGLPFEWEAIDDVLTVRDVNLSLIATLGGTGDYVGTVRGIADVEGYDFLVEVETHPKADTKITYVSGALQHPHDVDVGQMIDHLFGQPADLPDLNVKLLNASYRNDLEADTTEISMDVGGHLDLLGTGHFFLERVGFDYGTRGGKATKKELRGDIEVGGLPVSMRANWNSGAGWLFEGRANPHHEVHIDDLMKDLLTRAGMSAPPIMPDISLSELGAQFANKAKLFRIFGRAAWQPPNDIGLPWHMDRIETVVDVQSALNPQTALRETVVDLTWLYAPSEEFTFTSTARYAPNQTSFHVSWDGGADGQTIGLGSLFGLLKLDTFYKLPDFDDWSIFEFSHFELGYRDKPRTVDLQTTSRLGEGNLLLEVDFWRNRRVVSGTWRGDTEGNTLGISDVLSSVGVSADLSLPGGIGEEIFSFHSLSMEYATGKTRSFKFVGEATESFYKDIFLVVHKTGAGWRFITGLAFEQHAHLSDIPGLGAIPGLGTVEKFLSIEPEFLMVSSMQSKRFVPPIPSVRSGALMPPANGRAARPRAATIQQAQQSYQLNKGATFAGSIVMKDLKNPIFEQVSRLVGIDRLDATISVGDGISVLAAIPGELVIAAGDDDLVFTDPSFGLGVNEAGNPEFSIGGTVTFHLAGEVREIEASMYVTAEAALAAFHLQNFPMPPFHALPGVNFSDNFYVEMGVQFEPPGFDMGFEGDFYIGDDPETFKGNATVVMSLTEGVPNPLYIAFYADLLTLWAVFEAMTGTMARLEDAEQGVKLIESAEGGDSDSSDAIESLKQQYKNLQMIFDGVSMTDVAFHWAEVPVPLPDGTNAMPGVGFKGLLDLFGMDFYGAFEFSSGAGVNFSAHLEMEPVRLQHVVSITGDGQGLRRKETEERPDAMPDGTAVSATWGEDYVLEPGGPVFIVSSSHAPYLHANIHFELFDLLHLDLKADVDNDAMTFKAQTGVGDVVSLELDCRFGYGKSPDFYAHGSLDVHLKADFGFDLPIIGHIPIELDDGFGADATIHITRDHFEMTFDGHVEFQGAELPVPKITLTVPFSALGEIPGLLIDHIEHHAIEIFGDLFEDLGELAKAATVIVDQQLERAEHTVEALNEKTQAGIEMVSGAGKLALRAAEQGVEAAARTFDSGVDAVQSEVDDDLNKLEQATDEAVDQITEGSRTALHKAEQVFSTLTGGASDQVLILVDLAEHLIGDGVRLAADILKTGIETAKAIFDEGVKIAKGMIEAAEVVARGMEQAAEKVLGGLADAGKWVANKAAEGGKAVLGVGRSAVNAVGNLAGKALDAINPC